MPAKIVVTAGPDQGRSFALVGDTFQIGRSRATSTQLSDPSISRVHCEIELNDDNPLLYNISANGTFINGQPMTDNPQSLQPGDVIRIGATELHYLAEGMASPPVGELVPEVSSLVGQRLEEYVIDSIIATGENGIVFKANDLSSNNRLIALKVMHPEFALNEEDMQRFVRAMKTMIPVRHPHLVAIHGAGKSGSYCWIAMEYIDGPSLTRIIAQQGDEGRLPWQDAYRVAVQIGRALEYARELSIIHRNVTPANILYRPTDKIAKLGDLMLAKALEGRMAQKITRPGQLLGDAASMAPERTDPEADVDARADLYGLGATLYAVIAGRPPFEGDTLPELINNVRTTAPEPIQNQQPDVPELFAQIIHKLLAKKPEDRYQTPKALLTDLEQLGKSAGVSAFF